MVSRSRYTSDTYSEVLHFVEWHAGGQIHTMSDLVDDPIVLFLHEEIDTGARVQKFVLRLRFLQPKMRGTPHKVQGRFGTEILLIGLLIICIQSGTLQNFSYLRFRLYWSRHEY